MIKQFEYDPQRDSSLKRRIPNVHRDTRNRLTMLPYISRLRSRRGMPMGFALRPLFVALAFSIACTTTFLLQGAEPKEYTGPFAPQEALQTFRLPDGFRMELVAAEPDVLDPVAMSFDEDGRLYVIEMRDYPMGAGAPAGRVRLLEDTDGDGRID